LPISGSLIGIVWNGSVFCIAQSTALVSTVYTSPDGINWTARTIPVAQTTTGVGVLRNLIVLPSSGTTVVTSSDGINWSQGTIPISNCSILASNSSIICATAFNGTAVTTSADGITWTGPHALGSTLNSNAPAMAWNGTVFCLVTAHAGASLLHNILTSPDGVNWTRRVCPFALSLNCVYVRNSTFHFIGSGSATNLKTSDFINWESNATVTWSGITRSPSRYVAISRNSNLTASSTDGVNWTIGYLPVAISWNRIVWNGSLFCVTSGGSLGSALLTATSTDGVNWAIRWHYCSSY
jgi:hypothetical protein